jgi:quercetin dioxygenase-like cupin family protein
MHRRHALVLAVISAATGAALGAAAARAAGTAAPMRSTAFDWQEVTPQPTKVGEVRHFVDAPTPTLEQLEVHVTTLRPGEAPHPPHQHPEEELIIVKDGTVESSLNGQPRRLGPGSVILQASNELHGIRNVGTGPATYHVIKWRTAATPAARPGATARE